MTKDKKKFKVIDVLSITLSHHIHDLFTAFPAALNTVILESFSISNRLFGLLFVVQRIPTLFNPFIGILADKVRIRYVMIFAPTVTSVAMSIMGNMNSYISLVVLVFISGIGSTLFHVPTPVMMKHVSGSKPGLGMGLYMFGGELARTIGPVVALGAVDIWGFDGMFRLIPAGLLSSLILFLRFRDVDLRKEFNKSTQEEGTYFLVLKKFAPLFIIIASVTFVRGGMKSIFSYYLVSYLEYELGWMKFKAGLALSVVYMAGTVGSLLAGLVSDIIGKRTTLLIISLITPALYWVFILNNQATLPMLGVIGFFLLSPTPVFLSIVNSLKSKHATFLNGIYMTSIFVMSALATMLTGMALDFLDTGVTLRITAIVAFFAVPLVLLLPTKNQ